MSIVFLSKNKKAVIQVGLLVLVLVIVVYRQRYKVWDSQTEDKIRKLHPKIRNRVRRLIRKAETTGIKLRIVSGLRSFTEQNTIYDQGRTGEGNVVTNARAGESYHNYGLAFDVNPVGMAQTQSLWNKIGEIGKSLGFEWGGDWSMRDYAHFQYPMGYTVTQLYAYYKNGRIRSDGYVIV